MTYHPIQGEPVYIPVKCVRDDDGHWFIVPNEEYEDFETTLNLLYEDDEKATEHFFAKFQKYSVGGALNNYQLLISKEEFNRLTAPYEKE